MAFRTITARFAGTCRRCKGAINPGQKIRFGGKGLTYHFASECNGEEAPSDRQEREDRQPQRERFNTPCGCEDFPCCGCYGLHGRELYMPSEPDVDF